MSSESTACSADAAAASAAATKAHTFSSALVPADATPPVNNFVNALLTDMYQITMTYSYWKGGRHNEHSVFDMFFRKNPFKGEFTLFCGLEESLKYIQTFRFTPEHIAYLKSIMPTAEPAFFDYLGALDCSDVKIYAMAEGMVVFPRVPLMRLEGPLAVVQLLETTLLNICNFASLMCTNAVRHRLAVGPEKKLIEFGLRRAQGPDGAMSATRYSYIGGFDGTSNVLGGHLFGMTPMGTHAHSLVSVYVSLDDLSTRTLDGHDIVGMALQYREEMGYKLASNGELAAFISYAQAFPSAFLALVDTYDTLSSGVPNYICIALALSKLGYTPTGIRLDSGDLAYLSKAARAMFVAADARYGTTLAKNSKVVVSNDINEAVLHALNDQGHEIDTFGIGTNLVTCQAQPALGMVYKLVEIGGQPRIKLSQDPGKITIPGRKEAFRLVGAEGVPILDVVVRVGEARPAPGRRMLCRHPADDKKRAFVTPSVVIPLLRLVWKGSKTAFEGDAEAAAAAGLPATGVNLRAPFPHIEEVRSFVAAQLTMLREDHVRHLNPTPYKVSVSQELFGYMNDVLMEAMPVPELK